jgi:hypothetical protein
LDIATWLLNHRFLRILWTRYAQLEW